ncbi:MAG: nucleotidyl transferase AbiEii/AbiGii toxin family protein [Verrucomicrobia bacterium]|nr:nucleotidyl transferase AbiEii/AbiGii toxin family protein [Verrucomicrobiota bacterium]
MNQVYAAAADLHNFCLGRGWEFCFIGGVALQRWGEPRQTLDADLTLLTHFVYDEDYIDTLLSAFPARLSDAREFAKRARVLLLRHPNGVGLDIALGGLPFEVSSVARSSDWQAVPGLSLRTCSAEDLIVHKVFAARAQDWADVERILQRQGRRLDVELIERELIPLLALKEAPENLTQFRALLSRSIR